MPTEASMQTILVQEHKDKTIHIRIHKVLTWFGQPNLHPRIREKHSTEQYYSRQNYIQLLSS